MLNTIYCEFLKLKRSKFYLVLLLITCFFPITLCLGWKVQGQVVSWNRYITQVEMTNFMFKSIAMFALISSYIYTREFSCNTENVLFSYPVSRIKIFISKLIVILTIMLVTMVLELLLTILGGLLLPHTELTNTIVMGHLKLNFYTMLVQIAILPIPIVIGLLSKNVIMPMVYGGLATVVNMFMMAFKDKNIIDYIPISYSMKIITRFFKTVGKGMNKKMVIADSQTLISNVSITIAILTFLIGIVVCALYYAKTDID